ANLMLVVLNLPLVGLWVQLLRVPYPLLYPAIVLISCLGIYGANFKFGDVLFAAAFGAFGYLSRKLNCDPTPMVLGFILGPMMEENFRRALLISRGDATVFVTHPLSLFLLLLSATVI